MRLSIRQSLTYTEAMDLLRPNSSSTFPSLPQPTQEAPVHLSGLLNRFGRELIEQAKVENRRINLGDVDAFFTKAAELDVGSAFKNAILSYFESEAKDVGIEPDAKSSIAARREERQPLRDHFEQFGQKRQ